MLRVAQLQLLLLRTGATSSRQAGVPGLVIARASSPATMRLTSRPATSRPRRPVPSTLRVAGRAADRVLGDQEEHCRRWAPNRSDRGALPRGVVSRCRAPVPFSAALNALPAAPPPALQRGAGRHSGGHGPVSGRRAAPHPHGSQPGGSLPARRCPREAMEEVSARGRRVVEQPPGGERLRRTRRSRPAKRHDRVRAVAGEARGDPRAGLGGRVSVGTVHDGRGLRPQPRRRGAGPRSTTAAPGGDASMKHSTLAQDQAWSRHYLPWARAGSSRHHLDVIPIACGSDRQQRGTNISCTMPSSSSRTRALCPRQQVGGHIGHRVPPSEPSPDISRPEPNESVSVISSTRTSRRLAARCFSTSATWKGGVGRLTRDPSQLAPWPAPCCLGATACTMTHTCPPRTCYVCHFLTHGPADRETT